MNNLLRKVTKLLLGLSLAAGVGVAIGSKAAEKADAADTVISAGDVVSGSTYQTHETTDWIITFGGNNSSVGTNSGNRSKCTLSNYSKYAVSPVTTSDIASAFVSKKSISNIKSITYTLSGGSNQTSTNVYGIYSSNGTTFSQLSLTSGTQGHTISSGTKLSFAKCSGYFGVLFKATNNSGAWRIDGVQMTLEEDAGTSYTYSVSYDGNGNTGGTLPTTQSGTGTSVTLSSNVLTKENYVHDGWATSANGNKEYDFGDTINLSGNLSLSLYAHWVASYTISYNSNGGSGSMAATTGANPAVAACSFTAPNGKVFNGWNTAQDGTGTNYEVGATPGANLTLYAIWSYGVTYDFSEIEGLSDWGTSYNSHNVTYSEGIVNFASACKQTSTISDIPVTKGGNVSFVAAAGYTLTTATFVCRQWTTKEQTITLHYSTDGGSNYTSTGVTSDNFSIFKYALVSGTNAVKITFSSSSNQVGIESLTIGYVQNTNPLIDLDKNSTSVTPSTTDTISVSYSHLSENISVTQSSENSGAVLLSLDNSSYSSSLSLNYQTASPQIVYVKGSTAGTVSLTFSSTGATSKVCVVTVTAPRVFEKITALAKIKNGGSFVIANSETPSQAMSTTQNANNRGYTTATLEGGNIVLGNTTSVSVISIDKGAGDYASFYTLYEESSTKYLYAVSGQNYLRSDTALNSDFYYWSISFDNGNVVFTNKGNSYTIRWNGTNNIFSCYSSGQSPIALYELQSDIPADVDLLTIVAENASVGEGSVITYTGTYTPTNATEEINVSISSAIAELGSISMVNGTFTLSITGGSVAETSSATLTFEGAKQNVSDTATLTVTDYVATHTLVTSASSLSNGAKVVIACNAEDYNYSAGASDGGNHLPSVHTGFNADKTTLSLGAGVQEFTVWCVDTTNNYYVFSDGGYFLCSPNGKNNYMQRSEVLNEACYFTIEDSTDGVLIHNPYGVNHSWSEVSNAYTVGFNISGTFFSLYGSVGTQYVATASLYLSNELVNSVQGFVDAFMHFKNVSSSDETDTGNCKDSGKGYWTAAHNAYDMLSSSDKSSFCSESAYGDAYARLSAWASANGYAFSGNSLVEASKYNFVIGAFESKNSNTIAIIVIISLVSVTAIGGYFFIKRREEN